MEARLTIVIPVYNEAENLPRVRTAFLAYFKNAMAQSTVLFVNDGSTDDSLKLIKETCKHHAQFDYISFPKNYGLSAAIKAGFDHTTTALVGYIDSDLQTTPEDFNLLVPQMTQFDLVTGVRSKRQDGFIKRSSSIIANKVRRLFTNDGMDDTGCPLKIIKTDYAQRIPMFKGLHRFLPAMVLLQGGAITQIPVRHFPRVAGKAKFGFWNRSLGPLVDCFAYLWMKKKYITYQIEASSRG